jgi:hypothetical protein
MIIINAGYRSGGTSSSSAAPRSCRCSASECCCQHRLWPAHFSYQPLLTCPWECAAGRSSGIQTSMMWPQEQQSTALSILQVCVHLARWMQHQGRCYMLLAALQGPVPGAPAPLDSTLDTSTIFWEVCLMPLALT